MRKLPASLRLLVLFGGDDTINGQWHPTRKKMTGMGRKGSGGPTSTRDPPNPWFTSKTGQMKRHPQKFKPVMNPPQSNQQITSPGHRQFHPLGLPRHAQASHVWPEGPGRKGPRTCNRWALQAWSSPSPSPSQCKINACLKPTLARHKKCFACQTAVKGLQLPPPHTFKFTLLTHSHP